MNRNLIALIAIAPFLLGMKHIEGKKFPNTPAEGIKPVVTLAQVSEGNSYGGYSDLVDYVLSSPDQEEAGTCLYMALTGTAEFFLAQKNSNLSRRSRGPVDLSERYTMNISLNETDNWKTDTIYQFNMNNSRSVLDQTYPFRKGWYIETDSGKKEVAPNTPDSSYGTSFSWIIDKDALNEIDKYVRLPKFDREVIFADPESNQWNVGVTPDGIVEDIKFKLIERQAPVQVIYNHYGYWHAVMIVGFDDTAETDCEFTKGFYEHMVNEADENYKKAQSSMDSKRKKYFMNKYRSAKLTADKVKNRASELGGTCSGKGVFYVRDSIYGFDTEPGYDYDPSTPGYEGHYSKRIVLREYEWVDLLANHVFQVYTVN